ncbi:MAG: PLP-dependent aminotransferase family protein [Firmicutes bacterium]|nr:PLP-dependent aminotransferase family protein [Bacillota bacterium]
MTWKPDKASPIPLYEQIKKYLKKQIMNECWPVGSKIPTQRQLAQQFAVNRSTVTAAIQDLIAEGLLEGNTRGGTVVTANVWSQLPGNPRPDWQSYIRAGTYQPDFSAADQINKYFSSQAIRLGAAELSPSLYPRQLMEDSVTKAIKRADSLGYEHGQGSYELRKELSAYLATSGVEAPPEQILIVSGALQALNLIALGMVYRGSTILTENPSYLYSINLPGPVDLRVYGVPMDAEGIQASTIIKRRRMTNAAMLYTIPSFHNPTGISMSAARKQELIAICEAERLPVIEDDTYRELYFGAEAPKPLKAYDRNELVLFVGSMSKMFSPGLRIGWVVGNQAAIKRLADIKTQLDFGASSLSQLTVTELLASGGLDAYLQNLRKELKARRDLALRALDRHCRELADWQIPSGGFFIWLKLKQALSMQKLFDTCLKRGVLINPGSSYLAQSNQHIRISFAYADHADLFTGIRILSEEIQKLSTNPAAR